MPFAPALSTNDLQPGTKKAVKLGDTEILLIHTVEGELHAVEAKCPHAGAPLEQGALCNGRLVCPWHMGTFELETGRLVEPPPLRSLKRYNTKIEGDSILVDPEPVNTPTLASHGDSAAEAKTGNDGHVVTIGGGAAVAAAVCTLRQEGFTGEITVIDPVADEPVDRTNLSKMALAGKKPLKTLPLWSDDAKTGLKVTRLAATVTSLDAAAGSVTTDAGQTLRFDAAILAPGGSPRKPGLPGEDLPHVHTIRHIRDVAAIDALLGDEEAARGKKAVLIGDSFIAFEAASALTGRGLAATVVCRSAAPFSKKFGDKPAEAILALHRAKGVTLKLEAETKEITEKGVTLTSGESLPADLVIVAVGVQVQTGFAHGLPTEDDGGIPVDETLKAAPNVWVAGDAASVNGTRIEHWRLAEQHGRVAAAGILRKPGAHATRAEESYHGVPFFWTAHFGKRFGYLGHADKWDELQIDGSTENAEFLAYYVQGNAVRAVFGCGKDAALAMLAESMRKTLTLDQARSAAAQAGA